MGHLFDIYLFYFNAQNTIWGFGVLGADGQDDRGPELLQRRGLEGDVRRHVNVAAEERVELLADEEAEGREHGDAAVLQLDLAPIADGAWERESTSVRVSARADATVRTMCWRSVGA